MEEVLADQLERPVKIHYSSRTTTEDRGPEVGIDEKKTRTSISLPPPESLKTRKPQQQLASAIMAIYEVAAREAAEDTRREVFFELLLNLLSEW